MAKREKKVIISGVTRESADEAFAIYAKADAQSMKIIADIELQCAKIRERYANKLAELEGEKEKAFNTLQAYAIENQTELFAKKKSLEMAHGVIGFRTGTPKLKTLKGFTWASALQLTKEFLPGYGAPDRGIGQRQNACRPGGNGDDRRGPSWRRQIDDRDDGQVRHTSGAGRNVLCGTQKRRGGMIQKMRKAPKIAICRACHGTGRNLFRAVISENGSLPPV